MYPYDYVPYYPYYPYHRTPSRYATTTNVIVESPKPEKKLGRILVAPEIKVDAEAVRSMRMDEGRTHVVLDFDTHSVELPPEYTFDEIDAALRGQCYYRTQWTDEVGDIEVCVLHKNNSEYELSAGPFRRCRNNDHAAQNMKLLAERWQRMYGHVDTDGIEKKGEENEQGEGSLGIAYEPPKKRSIWDRLKGI